MTGSKVIGIVWALHRFVIGLIMSVLIGHIFNIRILLTWGEETATMTLWTSLLVLSAALAGHPRLSNKWQNVCNLFNALGSTAALSFHLVEMPLNPHVLPSFFTALSCLFLAASKFYLTSEASFSGINYAIILCISVVSFCSRIVGRPLVWTALSFSGMSSPTSVCLALLAISGLYSVTVEHPENKRWVVGPIFLILFSSVISLIQTFPS